MGRKLTIALIVGIVALMMAAGALGFIYCTSTNGKIIPATGTAEAGGGGKNMQLGLNFIRFFWPDKRSGELNTKTPYLQPKWIFEDFKKLGIQSYRQLITGDLLWDVVEPRDNQWNWKGADAVIKNRDRGFEPIVTLFRMQYASPTPPWANSPSQFQKRLGREARDYLEKVIARYGRYVKYWELGNEMDHWRAADPNSGKRPEKMPPSYPADGFSPQEQGVFLAQAAQFIRERDPDAVIIMPGMGGLDEHNLKTWLPGVIKAGGKNWFDVVNYHFYSGWQRYGKLRANLTSAIKQLGIAGKPVWMTETGSTASPTLTVRTNYPNSPESQAADVFRRIVQGYGYGDSMVLWHTYIGSPDAPGNAWRLYGVRTDRGKAMPSYYAMKLLAHELIPFRRVETLSGKPGGVNCYKATLKSGAVKFVAWGSGEFAVPPGMKQMTSVIPRADGGFDWKGTKEGGKITLTANPVLLK